MVGFDPTQLDQVNDVVQRYGFSDKRKRNQALRAGMENPGAFQEQNSGLIQEAQQPADFMGAGRKLAANQNPDASIASIFQGPLAKHGNEWYFYGDTDYSTAQFGTKGYNLKDTGLGTYDILDQGGNSLGKSYGSVTDAINKYALSKFNPKDSIREVQENSEWGPTGRTVYSAGGDEWSPPQTFGSYQEAFDTLAAQSGIGRYSPRGYWDTAGKLEDWEILGQVMNGDLSYAGGFPKSHRYMPSDNRTDSISGLNTLFDSSPLIHNGKLLGYKMDLGPNDPSQGHLAGYKNPFHIARIDPKGNTKSNYQLWRDIGNTENWNKVGMFTGQGEDFFVPTENASKLPGWTQGDVGQYSHKSSGLGSKLASVIGTGISLFGGPFAPIGYAINTGVALNNNNPLGALASIFGGAMNLSGADIARANGLDQAVGGGFSGADLADYASPASSLAKQFGPYTPMVVGGTLGALSNKNNPLAGALGGIGSSLASSLFNNQDIIGQIANKIVGGAANTGIKSLFNQGQRIAGSEYAGRSGGLNAFLQSNPTSTDLQQRQEPSEEELQDRQRRLIQLAQRGR